MTNTLNTPIEALEATYPLRVVRYGFRAGSGGPGRHAGGEGVVRELEVLAPVQLTLISERRRLPPYGLRGGGAGAPGVNELVRRGKTTRLPAKVSLRLERGDRVRVRTPGGGGWGRRSPPPPR